MHKYSLDVTDIVQREHPALRAEAEAVKLQDIQSEKIQSIISRMKKALSEQEDGVAIAAPQIGEKLRIFVVSGKVWHILKNDKKENSTEKKIELPDDVYINPTITKLSKKRRKMEEGCLSVRWLYGKVSRSEKTTVTAYNEKGEEFTRGGSGLLAQIFQHEIDHLDGILFIDKAEDLEEVPPEKHE
ncbi:MAG: hypothetical protein RJA61_530 [Candidatus Parcubacteria bacterium]|jgi:peptide deformylase